MKKRKDNSWDNYYKRAVRNPATWLLVKWYEFIWWIKLRINENKE